MQSQNAGAGRQVTRSGMAELALGPTLGCQNIWSERFNQFGSSRAYRIGKIAHQWNLKLDAELQYIVNQQNALRLGYEYQQQDDQDWNKLKLSYVFFY